MPLSTKRPLNPEDMKLNPEAEHIGTEVIMDGKILDENLKRKGLSIEWLKKEMEKQGYKHAKDIFLGICYDNNELSLFPKKN